MSFDLPWILPLVALVPAVLVWLAAARRRRAAARTRDWAGERGSPRTGAVRGARAGWAGSGRLATAGALAALALAGPRFGVRAVALTTSGREVVVAIDVSRSMLAEDVRPSRLGRAVRETRRLLAALPGDRVGLTVFAGRSYALTPPTVDPGALELFLGAIGPDLVSEAGTRLSAAIREGGPSPGGVEGAEARALVVFTDGESHESAAEVREAARQLTASGTLLVIAALGTRRGAEIPIRGSRGELSGFHTDAAGNLVITRRDDEVLRAARAGGAVLVAAEAPDQAAQVVRALASYGRAGPGWAGSDGAKESRAVATERSPRFWIPLAAAVVLLLWHALSAAGPLITLLLALVVLPLRAQERAGIRDYNRGTAALRAGDFALAGTLLSRAAISQDPALRFRALYNGGLAAWRAARADSARAALWLERAAESFRNALLLEPHDRAAKWNLELVGRQRARSRGESPAHRPSATGRPEREPAREPPEREPGARGEPPASGELSLQEARQLLASIEQVEREVRRRQLSERRREPRGSGPDW